MWYYINPQQITKEQFLALNGTPLPAAPSKYDFAGDSLPVCLVDNGGFTAAAIVYDQVELDKFARACGRPKQWFKVSKKALEPYYP